MANPSNEGMQLKRRFVDADDLLKSYVDFINVAATEDETVLSLYRTLPSHPNDDQPREAVTERVGAIVLSPGLVGRLARMLQQHAIHIGVVDDSTSVSEESTDE